ncbi:cyclopropane-fatty-acyl-phospholipid synthase family protein [Acidovorax sp. A1169]|uniref:SAM-dependent methyltransferase n=1 Tax=Acidovorax sp. A1169 TaxID=3059524 RepID=UPI002737827F|nr:cyclopropane-fatty-acyl-phospholipid synthase family protein [Acidovorax sp. A1169]MDP4078945.1 cyclopropane-fatty-acyl-phospholipid synthase family protein [Acidovorax sp. A1169]
MDPPENRKTPMEATSSNSSTPEAANTESPSSPPTLVGIKEATALLQGLFRSFGGHVAMRLWNGTTLQLGAGAREQPEPPFTLVLRSPDAISSIVAGRDRLRLVQAFLRGDIDIEGDFFAALHLKDHLDTIRLSWSDRLGALLPALRLQVISRRAALASPTQSRRSVVSVKGHSRHESRAAVAFHYDVSNDFYALWLDPSMVYSCAYFESQAETLAQAQHAKLDHICRKLQLNPSDQLLDIGCGWGALMIHAARHYGVHAHGVTLSQQQLELATLRIAQAGLQDRVSVALQDYRDLPGEAVYDKVASVGMFEHVGLKNLPIYFSTVQRLLKPAGLFLNHGITHYVEGWDKKTLSTEFINRYIFPAGELDTVGNIQRRMEHAGFEIADVEALR